MTRRDPLVPVREMRDYAREAVETVAGRRRSELESDRIFRYALIHLIEIVGEAAGRGPESSRRRQKTIEWSNIIDLRHRLVHGYDSVDLDRVWSVATTELPPLIEQLDAMLGAEQEP